MRIPALRLRDCRWSRCWWWCWRCRIITVFCFWWIPLLYLGIHHPTSFFICEGFPIPSALHTVASQNVVLKLCVFVILYFVFCKNGDSLRQCKWGCRHCGWGIVAEADDGDDVGDVGLLLFFAFGGYLTWNEVSTIQPRFHLWRISDSECLTRGGESKLCIGICVFCNFVFCIL